jgi:hypothetical protein
MAINTCLALDSGHLLRAALEHAAVARPALPVEVVNAPFLNMVGKKEKRDEDGNKITSAGAELAVGMEVEAHDPAADAAADALTADLNEGGCAGEMHLVVGPIPPPQPLRT